MQIKKTLLGLITLGAIATVTATSISCGAKSLDLGTVTVSFGDFTSHSVSDVVVSNYSFQDGYELLYYASTKNDFTFTKDNYDFDESSVVGFLPCNIDDCDNVGLKSGAKYKGVDVENGTWFFSFSYMVSAVDLKVWYFGKTGSFSNTTPVDLTVEGTGMKISAEEFAKTITDGKTISFEKATLRVKINPDTGN